MIPYDSMPPHFVKYIFTQYMKIAINKACIAHTTSCMGSMIFVTFQRKNLINDYLCFNNHNLNPINTLTMFLTFKMSKLQVI